MNKNISISIILLLTFNFASSQCIGNLGENIFENGDFGSGVSNILQVDPQLAPGYQYQTNPPPDDGFYTITNNTTTWGSFAQFWDDIGDNSPDPNGYMMVVNATYNPGLFYWQTVDGLCESTEYYFSADIYNLIVGSDWIKPNVSFLIDGDIVYNTGVIEGTHMWETYGFTFVTGPNQNSITLALSNNAPGGNGNDLAIDNISFRACGPEATVFPTDVDFICEDDQSILLEAIINGDQYDTPTFQWQTSLDGGLTWFDIPGAIGSTYQQTINSIDTYFFRYLLANNQANIVNPNCRVVSNEKLINVIPKNYLITDTICDGLTYLSEVNSYVESGIYFENLSTLQGCDSIVTLDLTFIGDSNISAEIVSFDPSCHDTEDGFIQLENITNAVAPFEIFVDEELVEGTMISQLAAGFYNIKIVDKYGCSFEREIELFAPPPFILELRDDIEVELGEEITINPTVSEAAHSFNLQSQDSISCSANCESITWLPKTTGNVSVSALSLANDCLASDSLFINLVITRKIYFPNVFTPNGNDLNDTFVIFASQPNVQEIESLQIYDRWGNLIISHSNFQPNDVTYGWDGTFNGRLVESGLYVYAARVKFLDGVSLVYNGSIGVVK